MAEQLSQRISNVLSNRQDKGLLRTLRSPDGSSIDFSSNDYLGFARAGPFQDFLRNEKHLNLSSRHPGATGSRLLSGHSESISQLEQTAAKFHHAQASLLFNSGYDANLSILSCLPGPDDAVLYDELIHASVHDGMRMGRARANLIPFRHNCVESMSEKIEMALRMHRGSILVCVETVYSMDGDVAPLREMLDTIKALQGRSGREIYVIADEAHAGGMYGCNGEGLAVSLNVEKHSNLLARVVTFGKAYGAHGAVILGPLFLMQYLINYARPFIYSTALPPHSIAILHAVYKFAASRKAKDARKRLWKRVEFFRHIARDLVSPNAVIPREGKSPIQGVVVPGNANCVKLSQALRECGYDVYPIRSPTVPRGSERIRVIIHAHNSEEEILGLVKSIAALQESTSVAKL